MDLSKLTAEQRLHRAHVTLMAHKKFILMSGILVSGKTEVVDNPKMTARTDGLNTQYGRHFVTSLTDKELNFLVLHENWHKAYKHMLVWRNLYEQNPKIANAACDHVINLQITKYDPYGEVAKMPANGCMDKRFEGMDARQVFDILMQEQDEDDGDGDGDDGDDSNDGDGDNSGGFDEHDWENAKSWNEEERKEVERKIDQALRQGEILLKKKGEAGTGGQRDFADLLEPKLNPYELLREFMISTCAARSDSSWRRPNRRFVSQDMYMPTSISESMESITIATDMSGSIGQSELIEFLSELVGICKMVQPEKIHLLYWDTTVCKHEVYTQDQIDSIPQSTKPEGGGGTTVSCVREYMLRHKVTSQALVIFTDGEIGDVGDWSGMPPTVWVISSKGRVGNFPGKVIKL